MYSTQQVLVALIVGLAVGTAIGIVLTDFWNSVRWRNVTKDTLRTAREQRRKRLQADERCELYRQLWLEAVGADSPAAMLNQHSRKAKALSLVEKAGV